jgi:hypothetical protein
MQSGSDTKPSTRERDERLSKDGQWRSFPKVPHLLQYASNGSYYGRIKIGGKIIRESLGTKVWTTAKLRLTDVLKKRQEATQAHQAFWKLSQQRQLGQLKRSHFKDIMRDSVRDEFGLGLRRDVPDPEKKQQEAWKGLKLVEAEVVSA